MDSDLSLIVPCETIGIFLQRVELVCLLDVDLPQMRGRLDLKFAGKGETRMNARIVVSARCKPAPGASSLPPRHGIAT